MNSSNLKDITFDAVVEALTPLFAGPSINLVDVVETAVAVAEEVWNEISASPMMEASPKAACSKGCGYCCCQPVGASAIEVVAIALRLSDEAKDRIRKWTPGHRAACAFLVDGACSIYPIRPLKCRAVWHIDVRHCMKNFSGMDVGEPEPDERLQKHPQDIFDGAILGLNYPLYRLERTKLGVSFLPALKEIVDLPDVSFRWQSNQAIFTDAALMPQWLP